MKMEMTSFQIFFSRMQQYSESVIIHASILSFTCLCLVVTAKAKYPSPKAWPEQFHASIYQIKPSGQQSLVDLWYDWPNGRNLNIVQYQLGNKIYDVEWTNGTSFYFDLEAKSCFSLHFDVGILRPEWLDDADFRGVQELDGFSCNVFEKEDFITYYEDTETQLPVAWFFTLSGMFIHVMTFEEGAVLDDEFWQAPETCFTDDAQAGSGLINSLSISASFTRQIKQDVRSRWSSPLSTREMPWIRGSRV